MPSTSMNIPANMAPEILYHYTSLSTFRLILANKTLWLSDISKMNDSKERIWLSEVFERVLKGRRESGLSSEEAAHYLYDFKLNNSPLFITCFSEDGDILSQWRAYADDGRGVSIGFRTDELRFPVHSRFIDEFMEEQQVAIAKCMYDRNGQEKMIADIVEYFDKLFKDLRQNHERYSAYAYDAFLDTATWCLRNMSCVTKHPGFSEEREWRAVYWPHSSAENVFFTASIGSKMQRIREGLEISYHEWLMDNRDRLIAKVVLGPKSTLTDVEVTEELTRQGFRDFIIRRSDIPYR